MTTLVDRPEQQAAPRIRKVSELKPQEDNPRIQDPKGFAALVESVKRFGFEMGATCAIQPVIVNMHPQFLNLIVGGEMRWRATQEAGFELIWVREVNLDAEQMRELTVRLNVPAGEWDWEALAESCSGDQLLFFGFKDLQFPSLPANDGIKLEGTDATVADAKKKAKDPAAPPELPQSLTRQFMIFLEGADYDELLKMVEAFKKRYNTSIATAAIMAALRENYGAIQAAEGS